jgi:hypothetical protein
MDIEKLFELGMKGLNLIHGLAKEGKDITPVVVSLKKIFSKHPGQVTDQELDDTEADLDRAQDEFEKPMKKLEK